eukprot:scaffold9320_cov71-Cyclotella_meneghiniana.AAC.15
MVRAAKANLDDERKRVDEENKAQPPPDKKTESVFDLPGNKLIVKGEEIPPNDKEIPLEKVELEKEMPPEKVELVLELEKEIPPEKVDLELVLEKEIPPEKVELELEKETPPKKDVLELEKEVPPEKVELELEKETPPEKVETSQVQAPVPTPPAFDFEADEPVIVLTEEPTENLPVQVTQLPSEDLPISSAPTIGILPFDPAEIASVIQDDGAEQNETHFPVYKSEHITNGEWWNEASEHVQPTHPLQYGLITVCIALVLMSVGMVGIMRRRVKNRMKNDGAAGVL